MREDYFGHGADNGVDFFSIPVHLAGGIGPNQGRFGTLGRNTFRGPAFYNFDFALIKDTPFGRRKSGAERMDLQFRTEFFNLFNIVNMGLPSNTLQVNQTDRRDSPQHGLRNDQQNRRHLAPDSVFSQADLLKRNSECVVILRRDRRRTSHCVDDSAGKRSVLPC